MKIAIVIVNWNTGVLLANCVESLQKLPPAERALISSVWVIDNASADTSMAQAQAQAAKDQTLPITFITNKDNVGFARANNQAIKTIMAGEPVHVLLLNPDTEVHAGALLAMIKALDQHKEVGIVGPRLLNPDGSLQGSVRPFPRFLDFVLYMFKLGRVVQSRQERAHDYSVPGYADQVMGAVFLIRWEVLQKIGSLDDGFVILFEEVDFALRARQRGWRTYYTPAGTVMHVKAASFNQLVGLKRSLPWLKSSLRYARKHLAAWQVAILYVLVPISLILVLPASLKHAMLKYVR
jgi:GT2 family glycosyltransferase